MKTLKINKVKYSIPENWYEIYLDKFLEIQKLETQKSELSEIDYNIRFTSIITKIPISVIESMDEYTIKTIFKSLLNISSSEMKVMTLSKIRLNGKLYVMDKHTENTILAQYIDLEIISKNGDPWSNGHKITASYLRRAKPKLKWYLKKLLLKKITEDDYKIVKYSFDELSKNCDFFYKSLPIPYICTAVGIYAHFLENFKTVYQGLFTSKEVTDMEKTVTSQLIEEYNDKWNWYSLIRNLAKDDLARFEEVLGWNVYTVFNDLSYLKETDNHKRYLNESSTTTNKRK